MTYEEIQPPSYKNQSVGKVDNFQGNAQGGHLVFQNEANFSHSEAYLSLKISCKFSEATWSSFLPRAQIDLISAVFSSKGYILKPSHPY